MSALKYLMLEIFNDFKNMEIETPREGSMFSTNTLKDKFYRFKAKDAEGNVFFGYITQKKGR